MSDLTVVEDLLDDAATFCRSRKCEQAIAALERAAQLLPNEHAIQFRLGICYTGACRQHTLVDADIAQLHLHEALSRLPSSAPRSEAAMILEVLAKAYVGSRQVPLKAQFMAAAECYREAAAIYRSGLQMDDWARVEYNLGNTLCEFPLEAAPDKWQQAVEHYTNALRIRTKDKDPVQHAKVLQNLGTTYRELPNDRAVNVRKAIDCYRRALQIYRSSSFPRENAAVHNNLGNAFLSLITTEADQGERHARRALRHFERALIVRSRQGAPGDYAITQFNRGQALFQLAAVVPNPEPYLYQAHVCLQEAKDYCLLSGQLQLADEAVERLELLAALVSAAHEQLTSAMDAVIAANGGPVHSEAA